MTKGKHIEYLTNILEWNEATMKLLEAHSISVPTTAMAVQGTAAILLTEIQKGK